MLETGRRSRIFVFVLRLDVEGLEQRRHQLQVKDGLGFGLLQVNVIKMVFFVCDDVAELSSGPVLQTCDDSK